jgi:hypothetical protein
MNDYSAAELATRDVAERLGAVEERLRTNQVETAQQHGLPRDIAAVEESVWKRLSPFRNGWPEVAEFDMRVAELEHRQSQVSAELQQLHDRELAAPAADSQRLAAWQLDGERRDRPEPTLPAIRREIAERQADNNALTVAIRRVLDDKARYVDQHRRKLTRDADKDVEQGHRRYLELIEELVAAREELSGLRRQAIWARLYPRQEAMVEPPSGLVGGHPQTHKRFRLGRVYQAGELAELLRLDASWLREAQTVEQHAALEGYDPRQPRGIEWSDDPEVKARRARRMAEWANSR